MEYKSDKANENEFDRLKDFIRTELRRGIDERFLKEVTGPDIFGEGNFEVYTDEKGEWQIKPVEGWKPRELKGIFSESNSETSFSPREEFQSHFECCTDEKWEWLKGFCLRNPVTGANPDTFDYNEYTTRDENGDWWLIGLPGGPRRMEWPQT